MNLCERDSEPSSTCQNRLQHVPMQTDSRMDRRHMHQHENVARKATEPQSHSEYFILALNSNSIIVTLIFLFFYFE